MIHLMISLKPETRNSIRCGTCFYSGGSSWREAPQFLDICWPQTPQLQITGGPRKMILPLVSRFRSCFMNHWRSRTYDNWAFQKIASAQLKLFLYHWYSAVYLAMELKLLRKDIFQKSGCSIASISLAEGNSDTAS